MRQFKIAFTLFFCCLSQAYALDYNGSNYMVYESSTTGGSPTLYVVPRAKLYLDLANDDSLPGIFLTSALPTNAPGYQISLSSDGHLSNPVAVTNLTAANIAGRKGAIVSAYKIYNGHFKNGGSNTWLLQANNNRDSILFDIDVNGAPYIYYNFGNKLDQSKSFGLAIQDVDNNGLDDVVTITSDNYKKIAFYSSASSMVAANAGLNAAQLGLLINDNDPYSVAIGEYYRVHRGIPDENIVHLQLNIPINTASIDQNTFASIKATVNAALPSNVQAIAIAWTMPYAVGSTNAITSAFARGFDTAPAGSSDATGALSLYYNSASTQPYTDFGIRPAMLLAAHSIAEGEALIDRGVSSDESQPKGTAHIMWTGDNNRNKRAVNFLASNLGYKLSSSVNVQIDHADSISGTNDTLFYFEGVTNVANITSNSYPNGAIVDNLTSCGGMLAGPCDGQTNILDFISGGATGTFGTVSEPTADLRKFPDPSIVIMHYTHGETLIEAYWKSISSTFQGLFIGDPLARPWQ